MFSKVMRHVQSPTELLQDALPLFNPQMKVKYHGKTHCTMSTVGARILRFYQALRRRNDDVACHGNIFASQIDQHELNSF